MSKSVQVIPYDNKTGRVETGAVQFGEDWPGLFIRGDNAFAFALDIQALLEWWNGLSEGLRQDAGFQVSQAIRSLQSFQRTITGDVVV